MHLLQSAERARVSPFEAALRAIEEAQGVAGKVFKGLGERLGGSERFVFITILDLFGVILLDLGDGAGQELGFDEDEAVKAPLGSDHFLDQVEFDGASRAELLEIAVEQALVFGRVFGRKDKGLGREAVAERVLRRALFAGLGLRAMGLGAVFARGLGFSKRRHIGSPGGSE